MKAVVETYVNEGEKSYKGGTSNRCRQLVNALATHLGISEEDQSTLAVAKIQVSRRTKWIGARLGSRLDQNDMNAAATAARVKPEHVDVTTTAPSTSLHAEMMIWKQYKSTMREVAANRPACPFCAWFLENHGINYPDLGTWPKSGWVNPENGDVYTPQ